MIRYILPKDGSLYKVNLHAHTTVSDGKFTPEQLKELYKAQGYSAIAYTDHRKCIAHNELSDESFIALAGVETDYTFLHVNGILRKKPEDGGKILFEQKGDQLFETETINEGIKKLNDLGYITTLNHPAWSDLSEKQVLQYKGMHGMEIRNSVECVLENYSGSEAIYAQYIRQNGRIVPIAADDCHFDRENGLPGLDFFQSFNVIKAPNLSYESLIDGIDKGNCFASSGPMFKNLWLDGNILHVECSPVCGIFVYGENFYRMLTANSIFLTSDKDEYTVMDIDLSSVYNNYDKNSYIWVQLRSANGKKAWSTPFWL